LDKDYFPLITLIFLFPLIFSPYTIEGLFAEEMENQAIIQFEYPKSLTDLKSEIQIQPELSQFYNDFESTNNLSSLTLSLSDELVISFIEYQDAVQKNIFQVNLQEVLEQIENVSTEHNTELNISEIKIKDGIKP